MLHMLEQFIVAEFSSSQAAPIMHTPRENRCMHACTVRVLLYKCPCSWCCTAPAQGLRGRRAARDYFSTVSSEVGHRGKIVPGSAGGAKALHDLVLLDLPEPPMGIPRAAVSPC